MKPDKEKTVLFSGRFDPVHASHIISIQRLGERFKSVIIVILDHSTQQFPVSYRAQCLKEALSRSHGEYEILVNTVHFGEIDNFQIAKYEFDVYATGNMKVLKHVEQYDCETLYVERAYEDHAEDVRLGKKIKEMVS